MANFVFDNDPESGGFDYEPDEAPTEQVKAQRISLKDFAMRFDSYSEALVPGSVDFWQKTSETLRESDFSDYPERYISLLEDVLQGLAASPRPVPGSSPASPCLFVSYRSTNRPQALWLARRASKIKRKRRTGIPVFLDVWDPMLTMINGAALPAAVQSLLTAIVIEIALLRCTHLIVVHTSVTHSSVWVPYELGRAKSRSISTNNAAFWHGHSRIPGYGYLVKQIPRVSPHGDLDNWLSSI